MDANLAALRVLLACRQAGRPATAEEQATLARWSGWGALPEVFDEASPRFRAERDEARRLLDALSPGGADTDDAGAAWTQARRTTLNAHYTSVEIARAMWATATNLGFTTGRVLEPGCGSGTFIGLAPDGAELTGVELDPTTAEVARHLYGARATIHARPFEEFDERDGAFDLVVGNVPFGNVRPHDPGHNRAGYSLHNYFLVKSLRLTRPGGLVLALTSRYTLDARNPAARRAIGGLADLVGAVRFPAGAFRGVAGTDVVEDLLVLRRRPPGTAPSGAAWLGTVPASDAGLEPSPDDDGSPVFLSEYMAAHPDMVLGTLALERRSDRNRFEVTVKPNGLPDYESALDRIVEGAQGRGLTLTVAPEPRPLTPRGTGRPEALGSGSGTAGAFAGRWDTRFAQEGSLVVDTAGAVGRLRRGVVEPYRPRASKDAAELRRLIGLRDAARELLTLQLSDAADDEVHVVQRLLTQRYEDYVRVYGPVNRYTVVRRAGPGASAGAGPDGPVAPAASGEADDSGESEGSRRRPRMGGFRTEDPDWPLVAALEDFDDVTQAGGPAAIFTKRVIAPPVPRLGVDTVQEAVAVCLDESGEVTEHRVAELLGTPVEHARQELAGHAYRDPETGRLVPAHIYLSGNVRQKLEVARQAAGAGAASPWAANVEALEAALPRALEPGEITARLGAPWVEADDVAAFCAEVLDAEVDVEHLPELGRWAVKLRQYRSYVALHTEWGTRRAGAITLVGDTLNQRLHTVTDPNPVPGSNRRIRNPTETLAAREKQEALGDRFSAWVWEEPARARRLADRYNELFRSTVLPSHDGSHLSLPGLSSTFTPRPHQRDAVARVVTDGRALLAHVVGAGKTATMVMAAMELRRLGAASKPGFVVPNHMLEQFSREWLQLYPTARLLVASKEAMTKARRKQFVARCAFGEWDGVIFTQSSFALLPISRRLKADYVAEQIAQATEALARSKNGKRLSVKKLENRIAQHEAKLHRLLASDAKDDGVTWEETGIDYLFVDEAHAYKNRRVDSLIEDVAAPGRQRPEDLDVKLWGLRRAHGPRTVTFATATPVANSIAELWVMQSYLHPDLLERVGVGPFDAWAATFARTHTALELAPDGGSYRTKTRLARYQNVPELLGLYRQVADVRTREDLDLPIPSVTGGKPETVVVPPSEGLVAYVEDLVERAESVRGRRAEPGEDNMLKVSSDGRRAALDLRLVGLPPDPAGGKLAVAARRIAAIHRANRDRSYAAEPGAPEGTERRTGALQLVFCDVSTPAGTGWNAYDELRDLLVLAGVPQSEIRFMQDARTDDAKAALFAACRDGSVAMLVGSTPTMGVGTNVQDRAAALHNLDAPWRPADIEQREGRILRQGNRNATVEILRYVTEGSFDTFMWQTLERKAAFISQLTRGDVADRDIDDIGDEALSYAEIKALASGDPRIMEKAAVDNDVARLSRLERSWQDSQHDLRRTESTADAWARKDRTRIEHLTAAVEASVDTTGDRFAMTVGSASYRVRAEAGAHLRRLMAERLASAADVTGPEPVARLGGLAVEMDAGVLYRLPFVRLLMAGGEIECKYHEDGLREADPSQLVQGLEREVRALPRQLNRARSSLADAVAQADEARTLLERPWEHAEQLKRLRLRKQELDELLTEADAAVPGAGDTSASLAPVTPGELPSPRGRALST